MKKLPKRAAHILLPLILSGIMTSIVSALSIGRASASMAEFVHLWPTTWLMAWAVGFPIAAVVFPFVRKLVSMMVED